LTPPLCGVLAAVEMVLTSPMQQEILEKDTYAHSLWAAVETCGNGSIPLTLLTLGGQLRVRRVPRPVASASDKKRGVALVLTGRFLIVPLFSCGALLGIYMLVPWLVPLLRSDPVSFLTLSIVSATPPALNLLTVAQTLDVFEADAAMILSYAY
ncbi:hypothetical protein COEREDRAFT_23742, partial [Coemansia reversa NRRL 1564]